MRKHLTAPAKCIFDIMGYGYVTGYKMISEGAIPVLDHPGRRKPVIVAKIEDQLGVGPGDLDDRIDAWFAERA